MPATNIIIRKPPGIGGGKPVAGWTYSAAYDRGVKYACTIKADVAGDPFPAGVTCDFGSDVDVTNVKLTPGDNRTLGMDVTVKPSATTGTDIGSITVTCPDGSTASLANCFSID